MNTRELHQERRDWVEGVVVAPEARPAPLSGEPTVYYELWAYGLLSGRCLERHRLDRFELVSGAQRTAIDASALELEPDRLPCKRAWLNRQPYADRVRGLLTRLELDGRPWFEHRILQLVEFRIATGDTVRIWGTHQRVPTPTGDATTYREPPQAPLVHARSLRHAPGGAPGIPSWSPPP